MFFFVTLCLGVGLDATAGSTAQILIDPYTGSIYAESGELVVPLYEGTFQLETQYIIGGLLSNSINYVGQPVSKKEVPDLEGSVLQFWQNACCYANTWNCPSYRESLKFGVSVKHTRYIYEATKKYILFHSAHIVGNRLYRCYEDPLLQRGAPL